MSYLRKIIRKAVQIAENLQQAEKAYFVPGILSQKVKDIIISRITNGDAYTKIVCDIYYAILKHERKSSHDTMQLLGVEKEPYDEKKALKNDMLQLDDWKKVKFLYGQLLTYDKNTLPIKGFTIANPSNIWELMVGLEYRAEIILKLKELPSIAIRNLRDDLRKERTSKELNEFRADLDYFLVDFKQLSNRTEEMREVLYKKMFRNGITMAFLKQFAKDKKNLVGGANLDKQSVQEIVTNHNQLKTVFEKGNLMVVEVSGPEGIKEIGCNSVWCFTYSPGVYRGWNADWASNNTNGKVYVIIDFSKASDQSGFMHVVLRPLSNKEFKVFDLTGQELTAGREYIQKTLGLAQGSRIMNFK